MVVVLDLMARYMQLLKALNELGSFRCNVAFPLYHGWMSILVLKFNLEEVSVDQICNFETAKVGWYAQST